MKKCITLCEVNNQMSIFQQSLGIPESTRALVPLVQYIDEQGCFKKNNGVFVDLIQIVSKNILNISEYQVEFDIMKYAKFYKMYPDSIKIFAMNFPYSTKQQQMYLQRKIAVCKNFNYKSRLELKLEELKNLDKTMTTREFYIEFFSDSLENHKKNKNSIKRILSAGNINMVQEISKEKKEMIFFKLNNMCTMI